MSKLRKALIENPDLPAQYIYAFEIADRIEKDTGRAVDKEGFRSIMGKIKSQPEPPSRGEIEAMKLRAQRDPALTSVTKSITGTGQQALDVVKGLHAIGKGTLGVLFEAVGDAVTAKSLRAGFKAVDVLGPDATKEQKAEAYRKATMGSNPKAAAAAEIVRNLPVIAKEMGKDYLKYAGVDVDKGVYKPNVDVFINKMEEGMLNPILDAMVATKAIKSIPKINLFKRKEALKKAAKDLSKAEAKDIGQIRPQTVEGELEGLAKAWSKLDIKTQLDNPNFIEAVGVKFKNNLNRLKEIEGQKIQKAIDDFGDKPVDVKGLVNNIEARLKEESLILSNQKMDSVLSKGVAKNVVKSLKDSVAGKQLTAKQIKERLDRLGNSIDWQSKKSEDLASRAVWKEIRNKLSEDVLGYDDAAKSYSNAMEAYTRKVSKAAKGDPEAAKFATSGFSTKTEYDDLVSLIEKSPNEIKGRLLEDVKTIRAWQLWNGIYGQNSLYIPASLRASTLAGGAVRSFLTPAKKGFAKMKQNVKGSGVGEKVISGLDALADKMSATKFRLSEELGSNLEEKKQ